MKYAPIFALILSTTLLAGCATALDGTTQNVLFRTVGADDAYCIIQTGADGYRYDAHPPHTLRINRSRDPMVVSCSAPGNRKKAVEVTPHLTGKTALNALNMGLGTLVDAESGAMYSYPNEVVIDFASVRAEPQPLPAYENEGALPPQAQPIEDLGPDVLQLPSDPVDNYKDVIAEHEKMLQEKAAYEAEKQRRIGTIEGGFYGDKGDKKWADAHPPVAKAKVQSTEEEVTIPKPVTESSRKYTPPKSDPTEFQDNGTLPRNGGVLPPLPLDSGDVPVKPLSSDGEPAVSITPLSQVISDGNAGVSTDGGMIVVGGDSTSSVVVTPLNDIVAPTGPQLGQPIFPSSTSF